MVATTYLTLRDRLPGYTGSEWKKNPTLTKFNSRQRRVILAAFWTGNFDGMQIKEQKTFSGITIERTGAGFVFRNDLYNTSNV